MLIKFGAIVVAGRGKLGGTVFSRNAGGDYARNLVTPINPQTQFQQAVRASLAFLSRGWSQLTQAQRDAWNAGTDLYSRTNVFGDIKNLSGKNLYTSLNRNLATVGLPAVSNLPEPSPLGAPTSILVDGLSVAFMTLEVLGTELDQKLVIQSSGAVTAGTSFVKNKMRVIAIRDTNDQETIVSVLPDYVTKFGTPTVGQKIFFQVYAVNSSGQASPPVSSFSVVA